MESQTACVFAKKKLYLFIVLLHTCAHDLLFPPRDEISNWKAQPSLALEHKYGCGDQVEKPPPYLPQPEDEYPSKPEQTMGPWAAGRVTCSREGGLTGLRPVADQYSITRYGPSEWRAHNLSVFRQSDERIRDSQYVQYNLQYNYFESRLESDSRIHQRKIFRCNFS